MEDCKKDDIQSKTLKILSCWEVFWRNTKADIIKKPFKNY